MNNDELFCHVRPPRNGCSRPGGYLVAGCLFWLAGGCTAFNPAFLDLVAPEAAAAFATVDNAPGHVVIAFINNAEVDERLISFLESADGGSLVLTDSEKRALRPRVRFRVTVTFINGSTTVIEFVDGSVNLIDPSFDSSTIPDLNQDDLDNAVVLCDVARVEVIRTSIEVFIPVELDGYDRVLITGPGGIQSTEFQLRETTPPNFRSIQEDQVDENGNTVLLANIGIRDVPPAAVNPLCGSVVSVILNGVLRVPFLFDDPSFDLDDATSVAGIGGRYEFEVSIN